MHPVIDLGFGSIGAYRLLSIIAIASAFGLTLWIGRWRNESSRALALVAAAAVAGALVGGRLWAAATAPDPFWDGAHSVLALRFGDMAMFGGIAGGSIGGLAAAWALGRSPLRLGDTASPGLAVAIALLRVGCLLAGCCFGRETALPWAITYPAGSPAHLAQRSESMWTLLNAPHPVHPIPAYEIGAALVLALVAVVLLRRRIREGAVFAVVVGGYSLTRLAIHPFRYPEPGVTPGWFDPAIYALVTLAAVAWWLRAASASRLEIASAPAAVRAG